MPRVIHDISLPLHSRLPVWPGDPQLRVNLLASLEAGDDANVTAVSMSAHTGTHVDAPTHFVPGGKTVDELDLDALLGPAWVAHASDVDSIDAGTLDGLGIPRDTSRLLLRTRNSDGWARRAETFDPQYVGITTDGAQWLVDRGIRLVGVDGLSVAARDQTRDTHVILLEAGVIPLEGLNLSGIAPGTYELLCLPLPLAGADGAPARTVLIGAG